MFGSTGDGGQVVSGLGRLVVLASYSVIPWMTQSPLVAPLGHGKVEIKTEQSRASSPLLLSRDSESVRKRGGTLVGRALDVDYPWTSLQPRQLGFSS